MSLTLAIQQGKGRLCQHSKPMEAINCIRYCAYPGIFEKKKCKNKKMQFLKKKAEEITSFVFHFMIMLLAV